MGKRILTNPHESQARWKRRWGVWAWAGLIAILLFYALCVLHASPITTFGTTADDALYFASAKALASNQGYVLPSFPVRLKATKYPELYPLLLAGIWKLDPRFPDNVRIAAHVTLAFGCVALIFIFLLLRLWPDLDDWQVLGIVALCAFSRYFLYLSGCVRTEVPFIAVLLAAVWFAERHRWGSGAAFASGLLAGLSVGFRSLGVAAVAGIGLFLLIRRDFRRVAWFSLAALPIALIWLWPALAAMFQPGGIRASAPLGGSGWAQTVCYYTSYACSWQVDVNSPRALFAVVVTNLRSVMQEPGRYLLFPFAGRNTLWNLVLVTLVSAACYIGVFRHLRRARIEPFVIVFTCYLLIVVPWPWTPGRFLMTFLPLFIGGLWVECRHITKLAITRLRPSYPLGERAIAGAFVAAIVVLIALTSVNYAYAIPSQLAELATEHARVLEGERGAFEWIREHTTPGARIIAYEDGLLYLYTGRKSIIPIMAHTQDFYQNDRSFSEYDASHVADVARHIKANYWLVTPADFDLTDSKDEAILKKSQQSWLAGSPVVYRDASVGVRLYDVACLTREKKKGCVTGDAVSIATAHAP